MAQSGYQSRRGHPVARIRSENLGQDAKGPRGVVADKQGISSASLKLLHFETKEALA